MDSSTKRRLLLGFIANWVSKLSNSIIQLVQVPVFLHYWGVNLYGEWMIVNSIPSYLAFSNIGFGSVAGNEMTMLNSANDREGALRVFQSCWWLISAICCGTGLLLAIGLYFIPVAEGLKLHTIGPVDAKWVLLYLGLSVLLSQLEQLIGAAYTCVGRYPYGSFMKNLFSLLAFGATIIPVTFGAGARTTALVYALSNGFFTLVLCFMVRRDIPWIRFGWQHASFAEIRKLTKPAIAFMGFPIGNALNLQGTLLAVGYALGPADVVIFGTARTVSRVALQMVQMVNTTFWPELSLAFGAHNIDLIRTLHRRACQMAFLIAAVVVTGMMSVGPWFLTRWTGGHVPPSRPLLAILLFVVVLYALWSTSSTLLAATNRHQKLAAYYIAGTSITVVFTFLLARTFGLYGAAASLLISEAIMNFYVLPASLRLSHDTWDGFLAGMLHYPPSLKPAALLARVARSKPSLES